MNALYNTKLIKVFYKSMIAGKACEVAPDENTSRAKVKEKISNSTPVL